MAVTADRAEAVRVMNITIAIIIFSSLLLASCKPRGETGRDAPVVSPTNHNATAVNAASNQPCVNLNRATAEELMQLPGIGEVTSRRIVEYRERHGPFRRPAEIIIVEGFSEKKYRAIAESICVE